ncbi:MAG TPA: hypothetical protein VFJ85_13940 [Acidimicrobiales bacterium]|nr:hypothetical protein [Acidimicrobiales bacterium]
MPRCFVLLAVAGALLALAACEPATVPTAEPVPVVLSGPIAVPVAPGRHDGGRRTTGTASPPPTAAAVVVGCPVVPAAPRWPGRATVTTTPPAPACLAPPPGRRPARPLQARAARPSP